MKEMAVCKNCGDVEEFEPDEFGLSYFQAFGECPGCNGPTYYRNGKPTRVEVTFKIKDQCKTFLDI